MLETQTVEQIKEMLATKRHKRHKKIFYPAKAQRRRDFRPECVYAVLAGSRDEVHTVLRRAQAGVNNKIRTGGHNSRGWGDVSRKMKYDWHMDK